MLKKQYAELCGNNKYTTTLHSINSAIVKLGKLTKVTKVYRGLSGKGLPKQMLDYDSMNVTPAPPHVTPTWPPT